MQDPKKSPKIAFWFSLVYRRRATAAHRRGICTMFVFACLRSDRNKERSRQAANFLTADDINTGDGTQWNSALRHATLKSSMYATVLLTYSQKTKVKAATSLEIL